MIDIISHKATKLYLVKQNFTLNKSSLEKRIFTINSDELFSEIALEIFRFQATGNSVYKQYVNLLKINPLSINKISDIPFLPIEFFKSHKVVSGKNPVEWIFESSGTTNSGQSKHYVINTKLYEKSFVETFVQFYGQPKEYVFLCLLPPYLERNTSSLVYMANRLIELSGNNYSGFYLDSTNELLDKINLFEKCGQKYILLGLTYALLDFANSVLQNKIPALKQGIVMETGGMKGKRKELVKSEVHKILKKAFGTHSIHSEYGMTELLSQAYSQSEGIFCCPPWMRILIRDVNDPFKILESDRTGGINIIDLANIYSCSFIATQDLGKLHGGNKFELLGRFTNSDLRGCNLLINE